MNMKRILSLALMALLLCMLPVWAMAEIVASGTNGENVNWSLDDEGTLTISGTGDMAGRYDSGYWGDNTDISVLNIKKVVIGDGITSIGEAQFRFHENLQSVVIGRTSLCFLHSGYMEVGSDVMLFKQTNAYSCTA